MSEITKTLELIKILKKQLNYLDKTLSGTVEYFEKTKNSIEIMNIMIENMELYLDKVANVEKENNESKLSSQNAAYLKKNVKKMALKGKPKNQIPEEGWHIWGKPPKTETESEELKITGVVFNGIQILDGNISPLRDLI